tara:strand:+ start:2666 stop:3532 length:867 start_codon:yes stop_codon:yes gene_type:complete
MKFSLGTAQFGLNYGITNTRGQILQKEITKIIRYSENKGIDSIDTAVAYGDSERFIGRAGVNGWKVVTKIPEIPNQIKDQDQWLRDQINSSLKKLKIKSLHGVLLHRPLQLDDLRNKTIWLTLKQLKSEGLVANIGYSIYSPKELDILWHQFQPDLVQAPYNIFDRRLEMSGWLDKLFDEGVEIHVRSIFLQGLLLTALEEIPDKFKKWESLFHSWDRFTHQKSVEKLQNAITFVLNDPRITRAIVGIDSLRQLNDILEIIPEKNLIFPENLSTNDEQLINPSNWELL